jgi:hypothetical protein
MRFKEVNSDLPNFNNTLLSDEKFFNDKIYTYCQRWRDTDTVKVQIRSSSDTVPTAVLTKSDKTTVNLSVSQVSSYDQDNDGTNDLFFFEFSVVMASYTTVSYITVTQGSTVYKSEPFYGDSNLLTEILAGEVKQIEYFNVDNAFNIDFSDTAGSITYTLYVEATIKDYSTDGEISDYDNQDEIEKLKETVKRSFSFKSLYIPRYLAETLKLASACDNYVINDISYIRQEQPEINPIEGSNLVEYISTITDKEYLGLNSHDIGFDCDTATESDGVTNLKQDNASGSVTFSIPTGYQIHTITAQWVSGTSVEVKLGTTLAGSDLAFPFNVTSSLTTITSQVHYRLSRTAATDCYATVTGGVANLDIQLIRDIVA